MEDFEAIYRRHLMEVYRYLLKISGSPDVAEELTQQTFAIAFEKLGRFQERGKTIVWLCQIAKLEYYAWCRKNRVRTERLDEELPSGESAVRADDKERGRRECETYPSRLAGALPGGVFIACDGRDVL